LIQGGTTLATSLGPPLYLGTLERVAVVVVVEDPEHLGHVENLVEPQARRLLSQEGLPARRMEEPYLSIHLGASGVEEGDSRGMLAVLVDVQLKESVTLVRDRSQAAAAVWSRRELLLVPREQAQRAAAAAAIDLVEQFVEDIREAKREVQHNGKKE
jgi:hypothetical protein